MRILTLLFSVILIGLASAPSAVHASSSIGVVDVIYILNQSKAAKHIQKQRQDMSEMFLKQIAKAETELRDEGRALQEERGDMAQDEFIKRSQAYETELLRVRKFTQDKKRAIEEAANVATNALRDELYNVVGEIAAEREFELVISNKNVITGAKSLDITQETLKRINKRLPKIALEIEGEEESGGE